MKLWRVPITELEGRRSGHALVWAAAAEAARALVSAHGGDAWTIGQPLPYQSDDEHVIVVVTSDS